MSGTRRYLHRSRDRRHHSQARDESSRDDERSRVGLAITRRSPATSSRHEELRTFLAGVQRDAATGMAELFLGIDQAADPDAARLAGSVLHALFIGIMVK